jgi:[acyl-carrier-protein] S-malonyltransferase
MKQAFLFPGQGSQSIGMGRSACEAFDVARTTFAEANDVLGWDLTRLCFEGPKDRLDRTKFTQPALLTTSVALLRCLGETSGTADFVAGHSLGEWTAMVAAGVLSFPTALRLVALRGGFMQEAVGPGEGAMAAVIGLNLQTIIALCAEVDPPGCVVAANLNAPDQTVISGTANGVARALLLVKERKGRGIRLAVSVPSHSPLMLPACVRLAAELDKTDGRDPAIPVIINRTGREITTWSEARQGLVEQLSSPLLWEGSIWRMKDLGVGRFVEIGPGRVLSGLMKKIDPTAEGANVEDAAGVSAWLAAL